MATSARLVPASIEARGSHLAQGRVRHRGGERRARTPFAGDHTGLRRTGRIAGRGCDAKDRMTAVETIAIGRRASTGWEPLLARETIALIEEEVTAQPAESRERKRELTLKRLFSSTPFGKPSGFHFRDKRSRVSGTMRIHLWPMRVDFDQHRAFFPVRLSLKLDTSPSDLSERRRRSIIRYLLKTLRDGVRTRGGLQPEGSRVAMSRSAKAPARLSWRPAHLVGRPSDQTIDAVRRVIAGWDGENWSAVRAVLDEAQISESRIESMTEEDVRQTFAVRQKRFIMNLGERPETATNSILAVDHVESPPRRPSDDAFRAWQIKTLVGVGKQVEIARTMSEELRRKVGQATVSRWLKQVEAFLQCGGVMPGFAVRGNAKPVDPAVIDQGVRSDRRSKNLRKPGGE